MLVGESSSQLLAGGSDSLGNSARSENTTKGRPGPAGFSSTVESLIDTPRLRPLIWGNLPPQLLGKFSVSEMT